MMLLRIIVLISVPQRKPTVSRKNALKLAPEAKTSHKAPAKTPSIIPHTSRSYIAMHTTAGISNKALTPKICGKMPSVFWKTDSSSKIRARHILRIIIFLFCVSIVID